MSQASEGRRAARVVLRGASNGWTCVIEDARELAGRIGHDLFAAFLKCFEGADRLLALEFLMVCNGRVLGEHSIKYSRNLRILVNLTGSTVYEIGEALDEPNGARVVSKMKDPSNWEPLNALRKLWRNDDRLRTLRNTFGFHLGKRSLYREGLAALLQDSAEQYFEEGEGQFRHDSQAVLPFNALSAGLGIDEEWLDAVVKMTQEAHSAFPELLNDVWKDVLVTANVDLVREPKAKSVEFAVRRKTLSIPTGLILNSVWRSWGDSIPISRARFRQRLCMSCGDPATSAASRADTSREGVAFSLSNPSSGIFSSSSCCQ